MQQNRFRTARIVGFLVVALFGQIITAPARAEGVWQLVEESPFLREEPPHDFYKSNSQGGATSATQTVTFSQPGKNGFSGKAVCQASWTRPPKILRPGDKISFTFRAKTNGQDTRGGYHFGHGCYVGMRVERLSTKGVVVWGGGSGLKECRAFIGGGQKTSASCNTTGQWTVPSGSKGEGLILRPTAHGHAPAVGHNFRYVFQEKGVVSGPQPQRQVKPGDRKPRPPWKPDLSRCGKDSGARFTDFSGEVVVWPHADPDATRPAMMDDVLQTCDHVRTEDDSTAILSFADMTTFIMKPMSEIILDYPPARKSKWRLIWGDIMVNVRRMFKDGHMDVTMKQAVAGIKGTIITLRETRHSSTMRVLQGKASFTSTANGQSVMVGAGQMVSATASGLSPVRSFNVSAESQQWLDLVKTRQQSKAQAVRPPTRSSSGQMSNRTTVERGTDRPGLDYRSFDQDKADPQICQSTCLNDGRCKAWTWVRPGVQGPNSRCWLKDRVPAPRKNGCCVSGVKKGSSSGGLFASGPDSGPARSGNSGLLGCWSSVEKPGFHNMYFYERGGQIYGRYGSSTNVGRLDNIRFDQATRTWSGEWHITNNTQHGSFSFRRDGNHFTGKWFFGSRSGAWRGVKSSGSCGYLK